MSLPEGFSSWEHLQSVLMHSYNRVVRESFRDLGDDNWDDDITTARGSLRVACTIKDDDSAVMANLRMMLFYMTLRQASDLHPPLYTIPADTYQQSVKFMPQVTMFFEEDLEDTESGYTRINAEVSFRLYNESPETFTPTEALSLANKIKAEFATGGGYRWHKGRIKVSYKEPEKGYNFLVYGYTKADAIGVIRKAMSIQGHVPDNDKMTVVERENNPPIVPPVQRVYGESRRAPRRMPIGWVRFKYAELHIHGMPNAITLVDSTWRRSNALVRA